MNAEPAYTKSDVRRARAMARAVIEHFMGSKPKRILHLTSGLSNSVFQIDHAEGSFIVRIAPEAARLPAFLKEQWCVQRAREVGVPVAEILEVGQGVIPNPYMIQRLERGEEATHHPQRMAVVKQLGTYARLIDSIETEGFGETFDWSSNRLSFNASFKDFLEGELDWQGRLHLLKKQKMVSEKQARAVRKILGELASKRGKARLAHGDLRLKNVLVDGAGKIKAIIDWEHCCSTLSPAWELSIALHDLSIDAKHAFLSGYGYTRREIADLAPAIKAFNLLHYAPHVERAAESKDEVRLESFRLRLAGMLDLYCLT
jgi:hygromycin-B 4-O-kinase